MDALIWGLHLMDSWWFRNQKLKQLVSEAFISLALLSEFSAGTIAGQWSDIEDFQGTAKDCTISWCSWEESTARAFAMLITLRGVLKCLINNNNNNNNKCAQIPLGHSDRHLLALGFGHITQVHGIGLGQGLKKLNHPKSSALWLQSLLILVGPC